MPNVYNNPLNHEKIFILIHTFTAIGKQFLPKTKISVISFTDKFAPIFITIAVPTKKLWTDFFYMYPKDKIYDTDGKDLNATANGSFYTLYIVWESTFKALNWAGQKPR